MNRILFVDDEPLVLGGLRDLLRRQRAHWDMTFALGGAAALDELSRATFDVVVSDMRMPGIDGVTLLRHVKELQPAAARIILSGHADRDAVFGALHVAHQFLSKPCETLVLRDTVERACALRAMLPDESLREAAGHIEGLPAAPYNLAALERAIVDPDGGTDELTLVIEHDPALAAKVLQLSNSYFFGQARPQTCVWEAVNYLGSELLKDLTMRARVIGAPGALAPILAPLYSLAVEHAHAATGSQIAQRLVRGGSAKGDACSAALLHDVGGLVLAHTMPERFAEVLRSAAATGRPRHVVERELLGASHAEIGAYLLAMWGLPQSIVQAVAHQHEPGGVAANEVVAAVHAAGVLARDPEGAGLDHAYLAAAGFTFDLPRWRAIAAELMSGED